MKSLEGIKIVVIDDDNEMLSMLEDYLRAKNFDVTAFSSATDAIDKMRPPFLPDLIISDIKMPRMDGIEFTRKAKDLYPDIPIILMTAFASVETAIEAIRKGAFDYITKPFKLSALEVVITRAMNFQTLKKENRLLKSEAKKFKGSLDSLIGKSPALLEAFDVIRRVAPTQASVLLSGEGGTGKGLMARSIHSLSTHSEGNFISLNCSSVPASQLEGELFGYSRAAHSPLAGKKGAFAEASGGTLYLEEIGHLTLDLQAKLLKVMQDKKYRPLESTPGDAEEKNLEFRLITSSSKDLRQAIRNEAFREDLYFRLAVVPINIPALRHRTEDISLLAEFFVEKFCAANAMPIKRLSASALTSLMSLSWQGNVRELESVIERLVVLAKGPFIEFESSSFPDLSDSERFFGKAIEDNPTLEILEKRYIQYILNKSGGKKEKAAQVLGINRRTLYRKEREYGFVTDGDEHGEHHDHGEDSH